MAKELRSLPLGFGFPLDPLAAALGPEALQRALEVLRPLQPLRRRELVGEGAGWAPTDEEPWTLRSWAEVDAVAAAARAAAAGALLQGRRRPPLLLGAVLRAGSERGGVLSTSPVGLEWADGPAADALQLGLSLTLGPGEADAELDLELTSGGWSPWAETWALRDGSLEARVAVAVALPGGPCLIARGMGADAGGHGARADCDAAAAAALRATLAGPEGVRAVVCIGGLCWRTGSGTG